MAGHTRQGGTVVCPSNSNLPSPPPSPAGSEEVLRINSPMRQPSPIEDIDIPTIPFHRQNPHWIEPAPRRAPLAPLAIEQFQHPDGSDDSRHSVVSTVLLDDDTSSIKTINEEDETTTSTDSEGDALMDAALATSIPLASIFSTPKEHLADVRRAARETGLHTGLMRRPGARMDGRTKLLFGHRDSESSWWVVIGRNAEAVKNLVNLQQRGMPGHFHPDHDSFQVAPAQPSVPGFAQFLMAGVLGGLAVLLGASRVL